VPVLAVPIAARPLNGLGFRCFPWCEEPKGIPVATLGIGKPGAANAALFAAEILALNDPALYDRLVCMARCGGHKKCWIKNCPIELSTNEEVFRASGLKQGGGLSEVSGNRKNRSLANYCQSS